MYVSMTYFFSRLLRQMWSTK